jgi:HAD superfamily hydrolase (TIGR01509 family)
MPLVEQVGLAIIEVVVRAVVFDFDGLILDTETPLFQAWSEVYRQHGQELRVEEWAAVIGHGPSHFDPVADLQGRLGRPIDRDLVQANRRRRYLDLLSAMPALPGVREWHLEAIRRGFKVGVASSSSRAWVTGHLERLELGPWHCIRCGDQVERLKPAPDLYLAVAECLEVAPGEALAIEDSGPGTQAARAAGMRCLAVPRSMTAGHDVSAADLVISSLAEVGLAGVLGQLDGELRGTPPGQTSQNASS